jgi:hypothetical protein
MSMLSEPVIMQAPPLPAANEFVPLADTTQVDVDGPFSAGAALPTPGTNRGLAAGCAFDFEIYPTGQAVTVRGHVLDGAGVWQLFQLDGAHDSVSVPAGTLQRFADIFPAAADFLITAQAGATPPTTLSTSCIKRPR